MQAKFEAKFSEWYSKKKNRYILKTDADYQARIEAVEKCANEGKLTKEERDWASKFETNEINGVQKLFRGTFEVLKYDNVFGVLHEAHIRLGHAGRNIMDKDLGGYHGLSK